MNDIEAAADLLAEGWEPLDITPRRVLRRRLEAFMRDVVERELSAQNIELPDPRWYTAHSILTGLHEGLAEVLPGNTERSERDG